MSRSPALVAACLAALLASHAAVAADEMTDEQKTIYAIGVAMSQSLSRYGLTDAEVELVKQGLTDGLKGDAKVDVREQSANIQQLARERAKVLAEAEEKESAVFIETMAAKDGAQKFDSGLVLIPIKEGDGANPTETDIVKVHYHGTLRDGTVFDSSKERGTPATFPLNRVIKCWTEGVQKMKVGGSATLVCPADIAYGERGSPPKIPPGAALAFDVELLEIQDKAAAPEKPAGHP